MGHKDACHKRRARREGKGVHGTHHCRCVQWRDSRWSSAPLRQLDGTARADVKKKVEAMQKRVRKPTYHVVHGAWAWGSWSFGPK